MRRRTPRPAYTLLEVLLAMAIGSVLLYALYMAMDVQLRHAQAGRDIVEQTTLARSLIASISNDLSPNLAPLVPANFRGSRNPSGGSSGGGSGSGGGSASGSMASSSASSSASSASSSAASTGTPQLYGSSDSLVSTLTGGSFGVGSGVGNSYMLPSFNGTGPVTFNLGVQGEATRLMLYVTRVPSEITDLPPNSSASPPVLSDVRRITYWLSGDTGAPLGLARQELKVETSSDALSSIPPDVPDEQSYVIAEQVRSVQFQYFDGTNWQDSWDGTALGGADGQTPQGPPVAIAITLGIVPPSAASRGGKVEPVMYRHVVALPAANFGSYQQITTTVPSTSSSTTTP
jgi:prepilin-type N-terminal cleavage/methylation domain-containing protein